MGTTAVGAASASPGNVKSYLGPLKIPLLAMACLLFNALVMALGVRYAYPITCGFMAGGIDGVIIAGVLVYTMGERLRAGAAGVLGGYSYHEVASGYDLASKYGDWLHKHSEQLLLAMLGPEGPLHTTVLKELKWVASAAAVVVMVSLIIELVLKARPETAN